MLEYLIIGQLTSPHGVKGELKVSALTDDPQRFLELKYVYIDKKGTLEKYNISNVKFLNHFVVLKFEGVNTFEAAVELKGFYLKIDRANAVKLPKDSFFITDILGMLVYDENNVLLGKLTEIIHTGSNDVYIVKDKEGKELLIPALKSVVKEVSLEDRRISVILPEGLLD
ncbi:MAG TPA: ribosome maturation factor RimM [Ruminiclostridium sp.]